MGLHETLHRNPRTAKGIAICVILLFGIIILMELIGPRRPSLHRLNMAFYSDDDGQTWFMDDVLKISPFDHGGKPAYRAVVYRCPDGKLFVGYLARYSETQQAAIRAQVARDQSSLAFVLAGAQMRELKKPGEPTWHTAGATMSDAMSIVCPQDASPAMMVLPTDTDTGATN